MTKRLLTALALSISMLLAGAAVAEAARTPAPTVRSISPMRAKVGDRLVITGRNFVAGARRTRVFFLREGGGAVFARSDSGTRTRLVVTVPERLYPLLRRRGNDLLPTRFQVRILARRFGRPTVLRRSPVIGPADGVTGTDPTAPVDPGVSPDGDCDGDGITNGNEVDDDNDLLNDDFEGTSSKTDPCDPDTEGDGVEDGYEYESALDLNDRPVPYPGKRPYPNPLDADANTDYDGDGLLLSEEFGLWLRYGGHAFPLNYSDGMQRTAPVAAPDAGDVVHFYMDMDGDGVLSDDEKDADGDELGNWDESSRGRMSQSWWDARYGKDPWNEKRYVLTYVDTSMTDPDTDGDTVLDGMDDQDHDGLTNRFEIERPSNWMSTYISTASNWPGSGPLVSGSNPWARVQPFNPCKPLYSNRCHLHPPFSYYGDDEDWMSIPPPAGIPVPTWSGGYSAP